MQAGSDVQPGDRAGLYPCNQAGNHKQKTPGMSRFPHPEPAIRVKSDASRRYPGPDKDAAQIAGRPNLQLHVDAEGAII
jgi:hypothetical protein